MNNIVNKLLEKHKDLFGNNPIVNKINIGFTNTIYNVDNKYIIKICSNTNNEESFKKEIDFYNKNKDNEYIPSLYYSDITKEDIPYMYEILEKIEGITLYHTWHLLSEDKRENIIKQLCSFMKQMHTNKCEYYDWIKYNKNIFIDLYEKAKNKNIFTEEEMNTINKAYSLFDKYLESNEVVLVHNDLHFDNIFINKDKIKIIDFERSMYAPKDFELHIIYYMVRQPWKHASEECEEYTNINDYKNIMSYIEKYYPEIISIPYLYKRLAIYDLIYEMDHLVEFYPKYTEELKNEILKHANKIIKGD